MDYMFSSGFLGTRAPFFMDLVTLIVTLLPFLVAVAIGFARNYNYNLHSRVQIIIFIFSLVVLSYFEYGVRISGGFGGYIKDSGVSYNYAFLVLILHIIISTITLGFWISTIIQAVNDKKHKLLFGLHSASHKKAGLRTFFGIILTSISGLWVYLLLFVF